MTVEPDAGSLSPRRLTEEDAANGYALSKGAGWNQLEADWSLMVQSGQGLGLVDPEDHLVGTAILLPHREDTDWIAMVLVNEPWRRKGVGTRLIRLVVELSMNPILGLDATKLGVPVYENFGFHAAEGITRYRRGVADQRSDASSTPPAASELELHETLVRFAPETARGRRRILRSLGSGTGGAFRLVREDKVCAVLVSRPGRVCSALRK